MLEFLPKDWQRATLVGRIQTADGPTRIMLSGGRVKDISRHSPTVSQLLNEWSGVVPEGTDLGPVDTFALKRALLPQRRLVCCLHSIFNASRRAV